MAPFSQKTHADLLKDARTLYSGPLEDTEIADALALYDYTAPDDFDAGLALVESFQNRLGDQSAEYADKLAASKAARNAAADVQSLYSAHRRVARRRHPRGTDGYAALNLSGPIPDARAELLKDAGTFYDTLAQRPDLTEGVRGLGPTQVTAGQDAVTAARDATDALARETGEAVHASDLLTQTETQLRTDAGELAEVARIALADRPQLLEKLGLRS